MSEMQLQMERRGLIVGVGTNTSFQQRWQPPDEPSPTITTAPGKENTAGWVAVWYESDNPNGFVTGRKFSVDEPCVTIMAKGMGGDSAGHWHLCYRP